jgi:hypothetical protein
MCITTLQILYFLNSKIDAKNQNTSIKVYRGSWILQWFPHPRASPRLRACIGTPRHHPMVLPLCPSTWGRNPPPPHTHTTHTGSSNILLYLISVFNCKMCIAILQILYFLNSKIDAKKSKYLN